MSNTSTASKTAVNTMSVKVAGGPHSGEVFPIPKAIFTVGRGPDNDIILINDPQLSRQHIRVTIGSEGVLIECLNSRNPILFKQEYHKMVTLKGPEDIVIGQSTLRFQWEGEFKEKTEIAGSKTIADYNSENTQFEGKGNAPSNQNEVSSFYTDEEQKNPSLNSGGVKTIQGSKTREKQLDFRQAEFMPAVINPSPKLPTSKGQVSSPPAPYNSSNNRTETLSKDRSVASAAKGQRLKKKSSPSLIFPVIVLLIVVGPLIYLNMDKQKKPTRLKDIEQIRTDLTRNSETPQDYAKARNLNEEGKMDRQHESAQSYYVKGFRDYRQGQYTRAISSFQATLSFDPNHVLARRYLSQSLKKESQMIQFSYDQARRYREKNNFRLCISSAQIVIRSPSLQPTDKLLVDSKKLLSECELLSKGRF